jgi:hypothetical protein
VTGLGNQSRCWGMWLFGEAQRWRGAYSDVGTETAATRTASTTVLTPPVPREPIIVMCSATCSDVYNKTSFLWICGYKRVADGASAQLMHTLQVDNGTRNNVDLGPPVPMILVYDAYGPIGSESHWAMV